MVPHAAQVLTGNLLLVLPGSVQFPCLSLELVLFLFPKVA